MAKEEKAIGVKTKKIEFKVYKDAFETPSFNIPIQAILNYRDINELHKQCNLLLEKHSKDWDWKDIIKNFYNSEQWGKSHVLKAIPDFELAMNVNKVLRGDETTCVVEEKIANQICDVVAELAWTSLAHETLSLALEMKEYFKELKDSKTT
jgi:hypothetical protein